jgi:hypothetical protein
MTMLRGYIERMRPHARPAILAVLFRYACFVLMIALTLWAEDRAAPHLPDAVIDRIPYQAAIDRVNHILLALAYLPAAFALLFIDPQRFCRYNVTSGLLSLVRGLCIAATGLGPVRGADLHAGMFSTEAARAGGLFWRALIELVSPFGLLVRDAPHVYLNKDLFFSGHTGVTFLLLLYAWPHRRLRAVVLLGHAVVVLSVFLSHLHYTIDVIGAYAVALSLYALREGWPPPRARAA